MGQNYVRNLYKTCQNLVRILTFWVRITLYAPCNPQTYTDKTPQTQSGVYSTRKFHMVGYRICRPFLRFLDPEIAPFLQFLDPEIILSIFTISGSRNCSISAISGSRNCTISTISGSRIFFVHFYNFWIQKLQYFCSFWIQKLHHFYNFWGPMDRGGMSA